MLNHSSAYIISAVSSWLEFLAEAYFFPSCKKNVWSLVVGIVLVICGEMIRKLAILTAGRSFNHIVQYHKNEDHVLVTHGVYRLCRHPSYAGWFWWCIGTQLILANPICCVLYAIVSYKFFYERILVEEMTLLQFFQEKYLEYQRNVSRTGLPFVKGTSIVQMDITQD